MNLLVDFLLVAGILIIAFIMLLFFRKQRTTNQTIVLLIFSLLFFVPIEGYCEFHNNFLIAHIAALITDPIGFLLGPLLLAHIYAIYYPKEKVWLKIKPHLIHFFLYFFLITVPNFVSNLRGVYQFDYLKFLDENEYILQLQGIYLLVYCLVAQYTLNRYQAKSRKVYSNHEAIDLNWIKFLNLGIALVISINSIGAIFSLISNNEFDFSIFTTISLVLLVGYLAYFGMTQSKIILPIEILEPKTDFMASKEANHHLSNVSRTEIAMLEEKLYLILERDHVFLDPDLTLLSLAIRMNISDKKLSALINHHLNTSFYDLINKYRVEEVKRRLATNDHLKFTLLSLAYDSGFNSKTTFNRIFKKETGYSPTQYIRSKIQSKKDNRTEES